MKDLMKKVLSFAVFDKPLQVVHVRTQFSEIQTRQLQTIPGWNTAATRQQLIANYWYSDVPRHFGGVFFSAMLAVFFFSGYKQPVSFLLAVLTAGPLSYTLLYFACYRNWFLLFFLPILETIKQSPEEIKTETLAKCKKAQLSTFSLILIFYVFDKTSRMDAMQCNIKFALELRKLYGRDHESIEDSLKLLLGKGEELSQTKITFVQKDFQHAMNFFEEMKFDKGISLLMELESKFLQRNKTS